MYDESKIDQDSQPTSIITLDEVKSADVPTLTTYFIYTAQNVNSSSIQLKCY